MVLARALYRAPQRLVLDEAASHLDVARERQVADVICPLTGATTRLLDREAFWRPRSGDADATTAYRGSPEQEDNQYA